MPSVRRLQLLALLCGSPGAGGASRDRRLAFDGPAFVAEPSAQANATDQDVQDAQDALREAQALEDSNRDELQHQSEEARDVQNRTEHELEAARQTIATAVARERAAAAERRGALAAEERARGDERAAEGERASANATLEHADREMAAARGRAADAARAQSHANVTQRSADVERREALHNLTTADNRERQSTHRLAAASRERSDAQAQAANASAEAFTASEQEQSSAAEMERARQQEGAATREAHHGSRDLALGRSDRANASAEMERALAMERNTSQEQWAEAQREMRQAESVREQVHALRQEVADERAGNFRTQAFAVLAAVVSAGAAVYLSIGLQREKDKRKEQLQVIKKLNRDRQKASNGFEEPLLQT